MLPPGPAGRKVHSQCNARSGDLEGHVLALVALKAAERQIKGQSLQDIRKAESDKSSGCAPDLDIHMVKFPG